MTSDISGGSSDGRFSSPRAPRRRPRDESARARFAAPRGSSGSVRVLPHPRARRGSRPRWWTTASSARGRVSAGSQTSLTGEYLRRRPSHSRASVLGVRRGGRARCRRWTRCTSEAVPPAGTPPRGATAARACSASAVPARARDEGTLLRDRTRTRRRARTRRWGRPPPPRAPRPDRPPRRDPRSRPRRARSAPPSRRAATSSTAPSNGARCAASTSAATSPSRPSRARMRLPSLPRRRRRRARTARRDPRSRRRHERRGRERERRGITEQRRTDSPRRRTAQGALPRPERRRHAHPRPAGRRRRAHVRGVGRRRGGETTRLRDDGRKTACTSRPPCPPPAAAARSLPVFSRTRRRRPPRPERPPPGRRRRHPRAAAALRLGDASADGAEAAAPGDSQRGTRAREPSRRRRVRRGAPGALARVRGGGEVPPRPPGGRPRLRRRRRRRRGGGGGGGGGGGASRGRRIRRPPREKRRRFLGVPDAPPRPAPLAPLAAVTRRRRSFLRESRTMAALQHPNVVFVYGVVRDGARLGIVEEFMRSGSLRRPLNAHEREAKSPRSPPRAEARAERSAEGRVRPGRGARDAFHTRRGTSTSSATTC